MEQPEGFMEDKPKVCLSIFLHGLKQSPGQLSHQCDKFLLKTSFVRNMYDSCVYVLKRGERVDLYLFLYVDDISMASSIME